MSFQVPAQPFINILADVPGIARVIMRPAPIPPASRLDPLCWFTCFVPTMHFAPSNLVASLAPHLQWSEEVYIQKCHRTVDCACFSAIKTSSTDRLTKPFLHPNPDPSPNEKEPKTFPMSCCFRIYMVLRVDVLPLSHENLTKNQLFL